MNKYEAKKQARIDRYREQADKAQGENRALHGQFHQMMDGIPLGQPIVNQSLRNHCDRAGQKIERAIKAEEKAAYYEQKAAAAENNTAISSDNPEALDKLKAKLEKLETRQAHMKKVNAYYRKHQTCHGCEGVSSELAFKLDAGMEGAYSWETAPYPAYRLSNSNQEIKRIKDRIQQLEQTREDGFVGWAFEGGTVEANTDLNRLQVFFDQKPDEATRQELKHGGFHWARSEGAWQRQLTDNAVYAARRINQLRPLDGSDPCKIQPKRKRPDSPER